jgi:hypothetical protein
MFFVCVIKVSSATSDTHLVQTEFFRMHAFGR